MVTILSGELYEIFKFWHLDKNSEILTIFNTKPKKIIQVIAEILTCVLIVIFSF